MILLEVMDDVQWLFKVIRLYFLHHLIECLVFVFFLFHDPIVFIVQFQI